MGGENAPSRRLTGAAFVVPVLAALAAPELLVTLEEEQLRVRALRLDFLSGKPLERLRDGSGVVFATQLSLSTDRFSTIRRRAQEKFAVSFDLWEERFSVTRLGAHGATASNLSASAVRDWCLDRIRLPSQGLSLDTQFWIRLDVRAEEPRRSDSEENSAISLARLIETFGKQPRDEAPRWAVESGPLRLADLRR